MSDKATLYQQARVLHQQQQFEEALVKYEEVLALDPNDMPAMIACAQVYTELGRHSDAIETAKAVCDADPKDRFGWIALSRAYQQAGMIAEAEDALARGRGMAGP